LWYRAPNFLPLITLFAPGAIIHRLPFILSERVKKVLRAVPSPKMPALGFSPFLGKTTPINASRHPFRNKIKRKRLWTSFFSPFFLCTVSPLLVPTFFPKKFIFFFLEYCVGRLCRRNPSCSPPPCWKSGSVLFLGSPSLASSHYFFFLRQLFSALLNDPFPPQKKRDIKFPTISLPPLSISLGVDSPFQNH